MDLPGYKITRDGRIQAPSGQWVTIVNSGGYARVKITLNGVRRSYAVKTLVCTTFHGPPPSPDHVAVNIDGDAFNNHADNLKWGTLHEVRAARGKDRHPTHQGEKHTHHVLTKSQVDGIRQDYSVEDVTLRPSQRALAKKYGVSLRTIQKIVHNKDWQDPDYTPPVI